MAEQTHSVSEPVKYHIRFVTLQRIEHLVFLISFSILGITGLIQKFPQSPISQALLQGLGGIEATRQIHHVSAIVMMIVSVMHIIGVLYRVFVLRVRWTMIPVIEDFKHLYEDLLYYVGLRKHKAYYGRYNYAEKGRVPGCCLGHGHYGDHRLYDVEPDRHNQLDAGRDHPGGQSRAWR